MIITNPRKGRIRISVDILNNTEVMKALLQHVIPLRIEESFIEETALFYCVSDKFSEVMPGQVIPLYEAILTRDNTTNEIIDVSFNEVPYGRN